MILRFSSGSVMPLSLAKYRCDASTMISRSPSIGRKTCSISSGSPWRISPVLMNTAVTRSPIAFCTSEVVMAESTPPLSAESTRPSPTWTRIDSMLSSIIELEVQPGWQSQILSTKLRKISSPYWVWWTSGWNCSPKRLLGSSIIAAKGLLGEVASRVKPSGNLVTWSPCDIQTICLPSCSNGFAAGTSSSVKPYSCSVL